MTADIETLAADTRYFAEVAAPSTPTSGQGVIYVKSDGLPYYKGDDGVEHALSSRAIVCHAIVTALAINDSTWTKLGFAGSDLYDPLNLHNPASNNSRFTADRGGVWRLRTDMLWDGRTAGSRYARHYLNGVLASGDSNWRISGTNTTGFDHAWNREWVFSLAAGDYVEVEVYQDSGVTLNVESATAVFQYLGSA